MPSKKRKTSEQRPKRGDRVKLTRSLKYEDDGESVPKGEYGWVISVEEGLVKVLFDWDLAKYKKLVWVFERDLKVVDRKPENRFLFRESPLCDPTEEGEIDERP